MLEQQLKPRFLELRKQIIENEFGFLNPMQREAVLTTEGALLILAGAGSGKTTVLINRIANLIRFGNAYFSTEVPGHISNEDVAFLSGYKNNPDANLRNRVSALCAVSPAAPWSIIAITFTNKAANELKTRLESTLGEASSGIWASTFHSACMRILHRDIDRLGYEKSFTIYDAADSLRVIKEIIGELELNEKMFPPKAVMSIIGKMKDNMLSADALLDEYKNDYRMKKIAAVYEKYGKRLKAANALDFDDIIILTVKLLQENQDIREYYQRKFRYVLIDEYQDTNHVQYLLAALLAGGYNNICVVGDDDQSIYRFRGATIENILQFEKQFKDAKTIRLEQNYRSTSQILSIANHVIRNNMGRKRKKLWTDRTDGITPVLYRGCNERDEAYFIANQILEAYSSGASFKDFAILYRINAQSNQFETIFKRNGIPYRIIGGLRFFDRAEIKDMLAYLRVIQNPADTLRLKRIINTPARKIGAKAIETVEALAERYDKSFFDIVSSADKYPELGRSANALKGFSDMIIKLNAEAKTISLSALYDELLEQSGYAYALESKNDEDSQTRLQNVMELKTNMADYDRENDGGLSGFLDEVSLFTDIERADDEADAVTLMTIHSAKGLEFPTVFLTGAEEGVFPSYRSLSEEGELEEERRLFYVAVTRAKDTLYITQAAQRMLSGQTMYGKTSRFVEEIPPDMLNITAQAETVNTPRKTSFGAGANTYKNRYNPKTDFSAAKSAPKGDPMKPGERVIHKSFGAGTVITASPVGGDVLLEIAFDGPGTKRLLYNTAAQYLKKE